MKRIISLCLVSIILLGVVPLSPVASDASNTAAAAAQLKDGYTLTPVQFGASGVDVSSAFILTAPAGTTEDEVRAGLSIDGQPAPSVTQNGAAGFLITPAVTLSQNSLYIFRLSREGKDDITWAFQTARRASITSCYPFNQATNVPVNSGIEITFSDEGYTPLDSYFSISPQVRGRFEYHKNTAVFVPQALAYRTVYTVTIRAGIKFSGTNEELLTDYVFSFETEPEPGHSPQDRSDSVYFFNTYVELPSIEAPRIGYGISSSRGKPRQAPDVSVYMFRGAEQAVDAVKKLGNTPYWARWSGEDNLINTGGLSRVMNFRADISDGNSYYRMLELPDRLSQGFYLIDASIGDAHSQIIVQISDLPVQVVADNGKAIVWVNDVITGGASARATVLDVKSGRTYRTDANGVAVIDRELASDGSEQLNITSANGRTCTWLYYREYYYYDYGYRYYDTSGDDRYWTTLQLDRTLFKRDDAVSFFGFAQNRGGGQIDYVTAELTQAYGYGRYGERDILHRQTVRVDNGAYSDELNLPNLDSGTYNLTIYHGDIALGSTYFTVADYVKPPYQIEVSADKKAVFTGETITFTTKAGFFEGTPVADLEISYNLYAYNLVTPGRGTVRTGLDGLAEVSCVITPESSAQGETGLVFMAEATLPEIGQTLRYCGARVFINDVDVAAQASRSGRNASLTVDVNSITLDRINNGGAEHYFDYLDAPVAGKSISAEVYRVYYTRSEAGNYYDYIEKRTVPRYTYSRNEEMISSFSITTGADGRASKSFTVPDREYESYYVKLSCADGNGRRITQNVYIGRDYSNYYRWVNTNDYYLDGAKDGYNIGEEVTLTLKRGTNSVSRGNFLFVAMQSGIKNWQAGRNPFSFTFSAEHIPNLTVFAYYFNGYNYQSNYYMNADIRFDYSVNDLTLTAATDKDSYKPGDMCNITVTATDAAGNAKPAFVNISIVDEALFALQDYNVDTLSSLYRPLGTGLKFTSATHRTYLAPSDDESGAMDGGANIADMAPMASASPEADAGGGDNDTYLREVFKDTAFFATLRANERGEAVYSFRLPDNITSWRLTVSGVSNDLFAGNSVRSIIVTNPVFLSYSLNDTFLAGDVPTIGVNVYGTALSGGETVSFEVWDESAPDVKYTASGSAFERVDIPLWEMRDIGENALIIKASVSNGSSDAVRHQFQVLATYREMDAASYYDVTTGTVFDVGTGGLTNITFTDRGRGQYLYQLLGMRYVYGDRVEKLVARREADRLLAEYFPDIELYGVNDSFNAALYQRADGGIAILPYADSDLVTTVKLLPYISGDVDINAMKNYLYNVFEGDNADNKMCALYGLAILREPVLLHLDNYSLLDGLPVKDIVYIALGYLALGENETAAALYDSRIAPKLERITPYYRVNTGVDNDDILEATSAACMLATRLEKDEKEGLYQYCVRNYATDTLITLERLSHIKHEIAKKSGTPCSITYTLFGQQYVRELSNGGCYTLRIPARNMGEFRLLGVTGEVGAVSVFKKPLTEAGDIDEDITVRRRYYREGGDGNSSYTFEQGDLVRVQVWIDYSAKALNGSYCVTDYLPSGLEYVNNSARISGASGFGYGCFRYCTVEGQRVTFYDYNGRFDRGYLYYYYARVVSPGTFIAEGPLVQSLTASGYYTVGEDSVVIIN